MSLNIQTPNGLLEIGGKVTKEKIISALEYTPANKTHVEDANIHVSVEDRQLWDSNSTFSGNYNDLIGAPNIIETDSGDLTIVDESSNIIMQVDSDGISTTNINTKTIILDGEDLGTRLDSSLKSDFSGDYNDLKNAPDIKEDESGEIVYADENGNIIARIDENGLETTTITANSVIVNGIDIESELNKINDMISFNDNGELVITINGVSKRFTPVD